MRRLSRLFAVFTASSAALVVCASAAWADSTTIAGAPVVAPGPQYYGNLSGMLVSGACQDEAYWLLPETAGDSIAINWATNSDQYLSVYPSGTTDYTVGNTDPIANTGVNGNGYDQVTLKAGSDGTLPLEFSYPFGCSSEAAPGPYNFNVQITHAMVVTLSPLTAALTGTATVQLVTPDGTPLSTNIAATFQYAGNAIPWTTLGQVAVANGVASIPYKLPQSLAGRHIRFRALGTGPGYATTSSAPQSIALAAAACLVPKLRNTTLPKARKSLRAANCILGKVHRRRVRRSKRGRIVAQFPKPGTSLADGAKVGVTLGV